MSISHLIVATIAATLGLLTAALCRTAADNDRVIPDNTGYPGLPTTTAAASRRAHPSGRGR